MATDSVAGETSTRAPEPDTPENFVEEPIAQPEQTEEGHMEPVPSRERTTGPMPGQESEEKDLEWWRDRALRLQAEMENFRRRQQRLTGEQTRSDRERLLRAFLKIADDLERALKASEAEPQSLREGVQITHQSLMRLLEQEGVQRIMSKGQAFDPNVHEAISTIPAHSGDDGEPLVLEVVEPGYMLGDRLLRPAKVVVSK